MSVCTSTDDGRLQTRRIQTQVLCSRQRTQKVLFFGYCLLLRRKLKERGMKTKEKKRKRETDKRSETNECKKEIVKQQNKKQKTKKERKEELIFFF